MWKYEIMFLVVSMIGCWRPSEQPDASSASKEFVLSPEALKMAEACALSNPFALPECDPEHRDPSPRKLDAAVQFYDRNEYQAALRLLTEILKEPAANMGCWVQKSLFYRGKARYKLGQYREAFDDFVRFIQVGPASPYFWSVASWMNALGPYLPSKGGIACLQRYLLICSPDRTSLP